MWLSVPHAEVLVSLLSATYSLLSSSSSIWNADDSRARLPQHREDQHAVTVGLAHLDACQQWLHWLPPAVHNASRAQLACIGLRVLRRPWAGQTGCTTPA